jgi:DMSO/TMAO reductase YedYZ molybdopterin-dependent catalytic subunit
MAEMTDAFAGGRDSGTGSLPGRRRDAARLFESRERSGSQLAASEAGLLAALGMLAVQLLWRLNGDNVPAFPEFIVAAIARLTPLEFFGAATENYGRLAQKSLFVAVLLGIVAVGAAGGGWAGRLSRGAGFGRRLVAGGIVTLALFLVTSLVILPIGYYGIFAVDSSHTGSILTQLVLTFALYAVAWAVLLGLLAERRSGVVAGSVSRRAVVGKGLGGILTLVGTGSVGALAWRIVNRGGSGVDEAESDAAAQQIAASARGGDPSDPAAIAAQAEGTPAASAAPAPDAAAIFAELDANERLTSEITSVADFYHVSKNIVDPVVDPSGWTLTIGGMVDREQTYTLDQLNALATTKKITTLGCISNTLNGDLIGTAEWQGVPLVQLLATAGVQPGVVDLKFHCADDYEDSIPLDRAFDPDTMVVVGMNGAPLTDDHGAPARLIVPGIYGMKNVKWVERIDLVDEDFQGYWQTRGWSDPAPFQIWGRIDYPDGDDLEPGPAVAAGMASAGDRGISRVEISLDDGETWADAILEPSINPPFTWVRWAFPFEAVSGKYRMKMRATDGEGTLASEDERDPLPDGATGWPGRRFEVK